MFGLAETLAEIILTHSYIFNANVCCRSFHLCSCELKHLILIFCVNSKFFYFYFQIVFNQTVTLKEDAGKE